VTQPRETAVGWIEKSISHVTGRKAERARGAVTLSAWSEGLASVLPRTDLERRDATDKRRGERFQRRESFEGQEWHCGDPRFATR